MTTVVYKPGKKRKNESGADIAHWWFFKADQGDQDALANRIEQALADRTWDTIDRLTLSDLDQLRARFP